MSNRAKTGIVLLVVVLVALPLAGKLMRKNAAQSATGKTAPAPGTPAGFASARQGRQQEGRQDGDNRDHDQEFYECKTFQRAESYHRLSSHTIRFHAYMIATLQDDQSTIPSRYDLPIQAAKDRFRGYSHSRATPIRATCVQRPCS